NEVRSFGEVNQKIVWLGMQVRREEVFLICDCCLIPVIANCRCYQFSFGIVDTKLKWKRNTSFIKCLEQGNIHCLSGDSLLNWYICYEIALTKSYFLFCKF